LCVPSTQSTIQCACADGFQLENDGKRCLDIGKYFAYTIIMQFRKLFVGVCVIQEEFEDIKGVIRIRISKNRQRNGQKK